MSIKERPILFSGPMVRAILDGRKTQTRRVLTIRHAKRLGLETCGDLLVTADGPQWDGTFEGGRVPWCPYGKLGDRLWVRETWTELLHTSPASDEPILCDGDKLIEHATRNPDGGWYYDGKVIAYRATSNIEFCDGDGFTGDMADKSDMPRWRPSIHMPRWASRITLEITGVRCERLQSISRGDCMEEGCPFRNIAGETDPRQWYQDLWNSINGPDSWAANPFVWVIEFRRLQG